MYSIGLAYNDCCIGLTRISSQSLKIVGKYNGFVLHHHLSLLANCAAVKKTKEMTYDCKINASSSCIYFY